MRFAIAGGGFAGLATALAVAREGHTAVVVERDAVDPDGAPDAAFEVARGGIQHYQQPHAFLPGGRRILRERAPDILEALLEVGADVQDLSENLTTREPGDEDLVYVWVRRPVIEWALRRAVAADPAVELRQGAEIEALMLGADGRATGIATDAGPIEADVVVDALGRYRCPAGWPRPEGQQGDSGAIYFCRYFRLADGAEHLAAPLLNPRGDLGYMAFNVFRGDNRTYAIIVLTPSADRELRSLRDEATWMRVCAQIKPLDVITSPEHGTPITGVMPMGGLMNVDRTADPGVRGLVAVGDALCHTDPAFSYGLTLSLRHAFALADAATANAPDADAVTAAYRDAVLPEARERYRVACDTDDARARRWAGEPIDMGTPEGSYPLFAFAAALATAPHDEHILRRTIRRVGLLDRTAVFDEDVELHARITQLFKELRNPPPPPPGPPREELLARLAAAAGPG
jgi:2-polyprenyl-6-methoxyphenol hydroxylase-like FAD-dependent oxidoreductase